MAKVSYAGLKLKVDNSVEKIKINDTEIEVLKYLPVEDKHALINITLQKSKSEGMYNPLLLDMFFHLFIVFMYTNISFTDKQREDEFKLYDTLKSNGVIDSVLKVMSEDEYNDLVDFINEELELREKYDLSISGLISKVINDLPAQAEAAAKIVDSFDKEKFNNVIDFAKSVNNGQLPTNV